MSTFFMSPKVNFEDIYPCLPDTSERHTNMSPTSCRVGLLFVCRILCRVVDCQHVVEMSSFELEGAYVTHIPYVCFYIRTWVLAGKISVGCSRHKRPRHLKSCVGVVGRLVMYCTSVLMYRTIVLLARPTKVRR